LNRLAIGTPVRFARPSIPVNCQVSSSPSSSPSPVSPFLKIWQHQVRQSAVDSPEFGYARNDARCSASVRCLFRFSVFAIRNANRSLDAISRDDPREFTRLCLAEPHGSSKTGNAHVFLSPASSSRGRERARLPRS